MNDYECLRFDFEKIISPLYHSDLLFMPAINNEDKFPSFDLKSKKLISENTYIYTTLNFDPKSIDLPQNAKLLIPVYGWNEQANFFYHHYDFTLFLKKIDLILAKNLNIEIHLEFQLNCLNASSLKAFLTQFSEYRQNRSDLYLKFKKLIKPSYLDLHIAKAYLNEWFEESISYLKDNDSFFDKERIELNVLFKSLNQVSLEKNTREQLLASLYLNLFHSKKSPYNTKKCLAVFPKFKNLLKESAKIFMEINPNEFMTSNKVEIPSTSHEKEDENKIDSSLLSKFKEISNNIECAHNNQEMMVVLDTILSFSKDIKGDIVEAGLFKGGATAKFSLMAKEVKRKLYAFDSFCGLPLHNESSPNKLYPPGSYYGTRSEVEENLKEYGDIDSCELVAGWFSDTLSIFNKNIIVAFIDVDLVESTKTCIESLWPLLPVGGVIFSHDGQFDEINSLFQDQNYWKETLKSDPPLITNPLNTKHFIKIEKR